MRAGTDDILARMLAAHKRGHRVRGQLVPPLLDEGLAAIVHAQTQSNKPSVARILRPVPRGELVVRFYLHLDHCKTQDANRHRPGWAMAEDRSKLVESMRRQWLTRGRRHRIPIVGRPQVLCVRYSEREPDALANWGKQAVDVLQPPGMRRGKAYSGLGIIRNDRPGECEVVEWWEPAKRGRGFCVIEVWSGGAR